MDGGEEEAEGLVFLGRGLDDGVVPGHDEVEAWDDPEGADAAVAEGGEGVDGGVGPVAASLLVEAIEPPEEAVAAEVIGLVVGDAAGAEGALAGEHGGGLISGAREVGGQGCAGGEADVFGGQEEIVGPAAEVEVEQAEAGEVPGGDGEASGVGVGGEGGIVLAVEGVGEEGVEELGIDLGPGDVVDAVDQEVGEQGDLPVVVGKGAARGFGESVAGGLVGEVPPGDGAVLESEVGVQFGEARFPAGDRFVEGRDSLIGDGAEEEVGEDRFAGGGDVATSGDIAPGVGEEAVADDDAAALGEAGEGFEGAGVEACLGGGGACPGRAGQGIGAGQLEWGGQGDDDRDGESDGEDGDGDGGGGGRHGVGQARRPWTISPATSVRR